MNPPDLVAVGHVTWDLQPDDLESRDAGGAVSFAAVTANRLGIRPGIVTSCGDDYPWQDVVRDSESFVKVPSAQTSTFENRYDDDGNRLQILHQRASDISLRAIPESWRSPRLLFVGPLTQELPYDCLDWFDPEISCVVPQGWLRSWGVPLPSPICVATRPPAGMSADWDICVVSESEVSRDTIGDWRQVANILVVTKGSRGADLFQRGSSRPSEVPPYGHLIRGAGYDTTGAGDVFAAAMLIRYAETNDPVESARYASICAALSTRRKSWNAVAKPAVDI